MDNITVTSAQYRTSDNKEIIATLDGVERFVPLDTSNRHYQAILDWVADGNTIQDAS